MAITSLILGILSIILDWIPLYGQIIGLILGILAIVLSVLGKKKEPEKKGMATAGLVLGIIGTVWGLIALLACGAVFGAAGCFANQALDGLF